MNDRAKATFADLAPTFSDGPGLIPPPAASQGEPCGPRLLSRHDALWFGGVVRKALQFRQEHHPRSPEARLLFELAVRFSAVFGVLAHARDEFDIAGLGGPGLEAGQLRDAYLVHYALYATQVSCGHTLANAVVAMAEFDADPATVPVVRDAAGEPIDVSGLSACKRVDELRRLLRNPAQEKADRLKQGEAMVEEIIADFLERVRSIGAVPEGVLQTVLIPELFLA